MIIVEDLYTPTSLENDVCQVHQVNLSPSWMDPRLKYLKSDILLEEKTEAEKIRRKAPRFWLSEDKKLYKRSFSEPFLLCIHPEMSKSLLEDLHEGICGSHTGEGPYLTGPLLKDTGGQICRRKRRSMLENVTSAKDSLQTSTSLEEFLILFPALGLLLSGV